MDNTPFEPAFYIIASVGLLAIIGYCALQVPRWITILAGVSVAALAQAVRGDAMLTTVVVMLVVLLLAGQVLVPLALDFAGTLTRLRTGMRGRILGRTLWLGLPLILAGTGSVWVALRVDTFVTNRTLYAILGTPDHPLTWADPFACSEPADIIGPHLPEQTPVFKLICKTAAGPGPDTASAIERIFDTIKSRLGAAVDVAVADAAAAGQNASGAIIDTLFGDPNGAVPDTIEGWSPGLYYRNYRCHSYHWVTAPGRCIKRAILKPLNNAYLELVSSLEAQLYEQLEVTLAAGDRGGVAAKAATDTFLTQRLNLAERRATELVMGFFTMLEVLTILSITLTGLAVSKSILLIYARQAYDPRRGGLVIGHSQPKGIKKASGSVTFQFLNEHSPADLVTPHGSGFRQQICKLPWHVHFGTSLRPYRRGVLRPARPFKWTVPRILTGRWLMSSYYPGETPGAFGARGPHDRRYVRVDLQKGARVAVRLPYILGFDDEVTLRSVLDVRLATLLQAGFVMRVCEGPGSVLLTASGGSIEEMRHDGAAAAPSDIIVFDMDGGFALDVRHGWFSTYGDSYSMVTAGETKALRVADGSAIRRGAQMIWTLLFFLLPI